MSVNIFLRAAAMVGLAVSMAASASAQTPNVEPGWQSPPSTSAYASIFQGLYFGANVGYGWGNSEHFYNRNNNHGTATQELGGLIGGVTAGYNYLVSPNVLVGVEADLGLMDVSADDKVIFDGHLWKSRFGPWWGTARARAGYLFGRTLAYGTGGLAFMQVDEVGYGDAPGQTAWNSSSRTGWVIGAGLEHALSSTMTAKVEYLHLDFGRHDGFSDNREPYYFDNSANLLRVGMNFKF